MAKMETLDWIAIILLIVGGLNWGLVAWFGLDLVQVLSFNMDWLAKTIYSLVSLSALYSLKVFFLK